MTEILCKTVMEVFLISHKCQKNVVKIGIYCAFLADRNLHGNVQRELGKDKTVVEGGGRLGRERVYFGSQGHL